MARTIDVILNAGAGSVLGEDTGQTLRELFLEHGASANMKLAGSGEEIGELAGRTADDAEIIVAAGGDGTVSAVAVEAARAGKILGVLPFGTLNHFAKDLGIPQDIDEAVRTIATGDVKLVDLGEMNGRSFINNSSIGLYPQIVLHREHQQRRLGRGKWSAAFWASLQIFRRSRFLKVRIDLDGKQYLRKTPFVFVGNNEYEMDLYNIGSRPALDEGKLSVYFLHRSGRWGVIMLLVNTLLGRLRQWRDFEEIKTNSVTIETRRKKLPVAFDGEVEVMDTPLQYKSRPKALKVIVPRS